MGLGGGVSFHVPGKLCEFYSLHCPKQKGIASKHQQLGKLFYIQNFEWEADIKKFFLFHWMLHVPCSVYFQVHYM